MKILTSDIAYFQTTGNWWKSFLVTFRSGHVPTYCSDIRWLPTRQIRTIRGLMWWFAWEVCNLFRIVFNGLASKGLSDDTCITYGKNLCHKWFISYYGPCMCCEMRVRVLCHEDPEIWQTSAQCCLDWKIAGLNQILRLLLKWPATRSCVEQFIKTKRNQSSALLSRCDDTDGQTCGPPHIISEMRSAFQLPWVIMTCGKMLHGPLTRCVKLRVAHAPGMPGTFSPPPRIGGTDMHHGTCVTHVPWCMPGSLIRGFLWSWWRGKRSRHSPHMRNPTFYVSGKRPMLQINHKAWNMQRIWSR